MNPDARIASPAPRTRARALLDPRIWLTVYAAALAAIAFWPTPVDRDAGPYLAKITELIPWLTYDIIEFTANVALFVPLGVLLTLILRRWWAVMLIALAATVAIEIGQALLLVERTPAMSDIIANLLGAAIGMLGARMARRTRVRRAE